MHPLLLVLSGALVVACGRIVPLDEQQACPCATGYTCCDAVCVAGDSCPTDDSAKALCPGTLALGSQSVPGDPDAGGLPTAQTVTGSVEGRLDEGAPIAFSYATSVWPKPYGWQLDGWVITATAGESLTFQVWADQDAATLPLGLAVYGPLEGMNTQTCSALPAADGQMVGSEFQFTAAADGTFFATPLHGVVQTSSGLAFEGLNDSSFADAFIVMTPAK
jgi:hypothetical protein